MGRGEPASADDPGMTKAARLIRRSDAAILWLIAWPTMLAIQIRVGGLRGLAIGFVAGMAVWCGYSVLRTTAIMVWARISVRSDQDVLAILDEALATGDEGRAIARLQDLIKRRGESFQRVAALVGQLLSTSRVDEAHELCGRAAELAPTNQSWVAQVLQAECLRRKGRLEESHEIVAKVVELQPYASGIHLTHAKVLADLGHLQAAESALCEAKRLSRLKAVWLATGGAYRRMVRKEIDEVEAMIASRKGTSPGSA